MSAPTGIVEVILDNWRNHVHTEVQVGPGGFVARGQNKAGKTSLIHAVLAVATGDGATPDVIRHGAERAVATVRYANGETARLVITPDGPKCTVKNADGDTKASPRKHLNAAFGQSIDPCKLILADAKQRVAMVRAAIPCTVTAEQIRTQWAPTLPANTDCTGHGLDVIGRVRDWYYEQRREANAVAKARGTEAERLAGIAEQLPFVEGAQPVERAEQAHSIAAARLARLHSQIDAVKAAEARTAKQREKIAGLREASAGLDGVEQAIAQNVAEAERGRREIEAIEKTVAAMRAELAVVETFIATQRETAARCKAAAQQADTIEAALADAGLEPVDAEQLSAAEAATAAAMDAVSEAHAAARNHEAHLASAAARIAHEDAKEAATRLDAIVKALTDDAPRALIEAANGITGISFDGGDVKLDGTSFEGLSGAEQVALACDVAQRANAPGHVLIVDGFERFDRRQQSSFRREARGRKWQIFAALVDSDVEEGAIVIEPIGDEGDDVQAGAAS